MGRPRGATDRLDHASRNYVTIATEPNAAADFSLHHANTIPPRTVTDAYDHVARGRQGCAMGTAFVRVVVLSTLLCLVAACGPTLVSTELTSEALRASGKGVLVISVRLVSKTMSTNCDMVQLMRTGDGRRIDMRLATHLVPEPSEVSGSVELDPGTYTVTTALCSRANVK